MPSHPERVRLNYETPGKYYRRLKLDDKHEIIKDLGPIGFAIGLVEGRFENGDLYVLVGGFSDYPDSTEGFLIPKRDKTTTII